MDKIGQIGLNWTTDSFDISFKRARPIEVRQKLAKYTGSLQKYILAFNLTNVVILKHKTINYTRM